MKNELEQLNVIIKMQITTQELLIDSYKNCISITRCCYFTLTRINLPNGGGGRFCDSNNAKASSNPNVKRVF